MHGLTRLVHVGAHETMDAAIPREKRIKVWRRGWKLHLIGRGNPEWMDLFLTLYLA